MSALSSFQESAKKAATTVMNNGPAALQQLQAAYQAKFDAVALSAIQAKFASLQDIKENSIMMDIVAATQDSTDTVLLNVAVLEQYVTMTIPKMEDGNNFGVTVQLAALKQMNDLQEKLEKGLEELSKYASARADALEKCKQLPSSTNTTSTTTTKSDSQGNNTEKGDVTSKETKTVSEETKKQTIQESPELAYRQQAVLAVDVLYYRKAKSLFETLLTGYMASLDIMDKNSEKIGAPKGSEHGRSAFSSMY